MRLLLVEDDAMIGEALQASLRESSFAVDWVTNGKLAVNAVDCQYYDVLVLDLGLPDKGGLAVLRHLRNRKHQTSVLIVTARDELEDKITSLNSGADDYLVKPFDFSELLARIRAVIRRRHGQLESVISNGLLTLDLLTKQARVGSGRPVQLTNREFALLEALLQKPGTILSRAELEDRIYGWEEEVESNAVEYHIHTLRHKLGRESIRNVRGLGWLTSKLD
jgi:two-component system OmpR family response regulator